MTQPQQLTAEQQQAMASLERLRAAIAKFHAARLTTDEALAGMRVVRDAAGQIKHPSTLMPVVQGVRDGAAERNAVTQLRDLLRLVYQREPTPEEMRLSVPPTESLGIWWLAPVAISAIVGGSFSLTSLFDYLAEKEKTAQYQMGLRPTATWADVVRDWAPTIVPAVAVVGIGVGGWVLWNKYGDSIRAGAARAFQKNPPELEEHEPEEIDSLECDDEAE